MPPPFSGSLEYNWVGLLGSPLRHEHDTPLPFTYCARQPHRRSHRRGRPPPRHGPAIPSTLRPNQPIHHYPLPPPVLTHLPDHLKPGPRRRTAVEPHRRSTPAGSPPPPRHRPLTSFPLLAGTWAHAHGAVRAGGPSWAACRTRAPAGPKFPPPPRPS
jgi:hypothetical protein